MIDHEILNRAIQEKSIVSRITRCANSGCWSRGGATMSDRVNHHVATEVGLLIDRLEKFYGALPSPPRDPFTLFVWEVLSPHASPKKRDAALAALKRARALTPDAMWRAPQKTL